MSTVTQLVCKSLTAKLVKATDIRMEPNYGINTDAMSSMDLGTKHLRL